MAHLGAPHLINFLGLFAGALGVSIAIWLQFITRRTVRALYVTSFFVAGSSLMLLNLEPVWGHTDGVLAARLVAYIALTTLEIYVGYRVWQEAEVHPVERVKNFPITEDNGNNH